MFRLCRRLVATLVLLIAATPVCAQEEEPLTAEVIIEAKQLGIEDADILAELRATRQKLVLTTAQLRRLKQAGAGPELLKALSASSGATPKVTPKVTPEATPASAPRPPRDVTGDRPVGTWTPPVWLDRNVAPATSTTERSFAVMKRMFDLFLAYTNQGRYAEAAEFLATHTVMAETNALPRWAIGLSWLELARAHLWNGDSEQGLEALARAVENGLGEPFSFHEIVPRDLWSDDRVQALYDRIQLEAADLHEIVWARAEVDALNHDTQTMIAFNMGRRDDGWTRVASVAIPNRPTGSPAVESYRQGLAYLQQRQREQVMESDQIRIGHLNTMRIIESRDVPIEESLASSREAERRDLEHAGGIARRQYFPQDPGGAATLPALGSVPVEQSIPAAVARPRHSTDGAPSPWQNVRTGDWWRFEYQIESGDAVVATGTNHQWVTGRHGDDLALVSIGSSKDGTTVEDIFSRAQPTNRLQMVSDYSLEAPLELQSYEESATTCQWKGEEVDAVRVVARFQWTLNGQRELWTLNGVLAPSVVPGEWVRVRLERPGFAYRRTLTDSGRGN